MLRKLLDALEGPAGDDVSEALETTAIDRVLLVDDDEASHPGVRAAIEQAGVVKNVVVVKDGREAFRFLHKDVPPTPTLILLDINKPVVDAWELLKNYSTLPASARREYSIVMQAGAVTGEDLPGTGEGEPGDAGFKKPPHYEALINTIRAHLFPEDGDE